MARFMSFALTIEQFRARTKTVTRRKGWSHLKPGEFLMGVEKAMGLKKGERIRRLGLIKVESVRSEPIKAISQRDVILEGFPDWTPSQFVDFYCRHNKQTPDDLTNRIQFCYEDVERDQAAMDLLQEAWDMAENNCEDMLITRENFGDELGPWINGTTEEFPPLLWEHLSEDQRTKIYDRLWPRPRRVLLKGSSNAA